MSRLITNAIRSTSATADAITMDGSGNVTFPANATCSGTATGFGKILQVKSATKTDTASTNITRDSDWTGHGLSVSITPSSASNKIFISGYFMVGANTGENLFYKLFKGGSVITGATGDADSNRSRVTASVPVRSDQAYVVYSLPIHYLDTAGSTSSLTYTPAIGVSSENNKTIYVNRPQSSVDNANYVRTISVLTAIEVAA